MAEAGLTATVATGTAVTVIADVPLFVSDVAVMVAEPATTPRTKPLELTVATDALLLAHVIVRPVSGFPLASFGVAVSCAVCPAGTEAEAGLTVTVATGTVIQNKATIVFDLNAPIDTPTWSNTIDKTMPTSHVNPLPPRISFMTSTASGRT